MTAHLNGDTAVSCFTVYRYRYCVSMKQLTPLKDCITRRKNPSLRQGYCYVATKNRAVVTLRQRTGLLLRCDKEQGCCYIATKNSTIKLQYGVQATNDCR